MLSVPVCKSRKAKPKGQERVGVVAGRSLGLCKRGLCNYYFKSGESLQQLQLSQASPSSSQGSATRSTATSSSSQADTTA